MNIQCRLFIVLGVTLLITNCAVATDDRESLTHEWAIATEGKNVIQLQVSVLKDKIKGGWAGQVIGCTYGGDTEFTHKGTFIADYQPIQWWDGKIQSNFKNRPGLYDDIYMDMSFLKVLYEKGLDASAVQLAEPFANADYPLWHANQAARYNILNGLEPPASGFWKNNPHADDIDFQIESDFIGLIAPGMLQTVVQLGDKIGHIMNYGDGWYGGVYVASMVSLAFVTEDIETIVTQALKSIPAESDFYRCIRDVISWHILYPDDWKRTWFEIQKKWAQDYGCPSGVFHPFNIDAKINAAYVVTGLLYGNGDFVRTLEIATRCGQDSDCNPATAGGILGVIKGYSKLPTDFLEDLASVENQHFKYTDKSLKDAYRMTYDLALQLIRKNGGKISEEQVNIKMQRPQTVRFEKGWVEHHPRMRLWIDQELNSKMHLPFHGNGVVVTGYAHKKEAQAPDKVLHISAEIDGRKAEIIMLPTDKRKWRTDLFWKYGLSSEEHVLTLQWLDPDTMFEVKVREAIIYSPQPFSVQ